MSNLSLMDPEKFFLNSASAMKVHTAMLSLVKVLSRGKYKGGETTKLRKRVRQLQHCLTHLHQQQLSLLVGLECLQEKVWPCVLEILRKSPPKQSSWTKLLVSVFGQLLRLHDGLILCISGECRHESDVRRIQKLPFRSQLGRTAKRDDKDKTSNTHCRADGYTQLYSTGSTKLYSGTSWDEIMDETAGLQVRLWQIAPTKLSKDDWWDRLLEGAPLLEQLLTEIETRQSTIQNEIQRMVTNIPLQLQSALLQNYSAVRVTLKLADKLEQWHVTAGGERLQLGRYARDFQIQDERGVLPPFQTVSEWENIMMPEIHRIVETMKSVGCSSDDGKAAKKRRVIVESEDDDDDASDSDGRAQNTHRMKNSMSRGNADKDQNQGLKVQHQTADENDIPESGKKDSVSISIIKQQMGVDVDSLTKARETLEAEELETAKAAAAVDLEEGGMYATDLVDEEAIHHTEHRIRRMKKCLQKALQRCDGSIDSQYNVWNTREHLRQLAMEAGNLLLWAEVDGDRVNASISQSVEYFELAGNLVKQQQQLHEDMVAQKNCEILPSFSRDLLLLRGQAAVNIGIAKIELTSPNTTVERRHTEAIRHEAKESLKVAVQSAREVLEIVQGSACQDAEEWSDEYKAHQLKALASRWLGMLLWEQGQRHEAEFLFQQAGDAQPTNHSSLGALSDMTGAEIDLALERYYAWTTLAQLASTSLDHIPHCSFKDKGASSRNEEIFESAKMAISRAAGVSSSLCGLLNDNWEAFALTNGVQSQEELKKSLAGLKERWKSRKEASTEALSCGGERKRQDEGPRLEVGSRDTQFENKHPPERFVLMGLHQAQGKAKQRKFKGQSSGYGSIVPPRKTASKPKEAPRRYRKWGDMLLPQEKDENGNSVPILPFPACAPTMPDDVRSLLDSEMYSSTATCRRSS